MGLAGAWWGAMNGAGGYLKSLHNRERFGATPRFPSAHLRGTKCVFFSESDGEMRTESLMCLFVGRYYTMWTKFLSFFHC